jgi:hypothetical protein
LGQWDPRLGHNTFTVLVAIKLFLINVKFSENQLLTMPKLLELFGIIIDVEKLGGVMCLSLVQNYFFCSHPNYKNFKRFLFYYQNYMYVCVRKCRNAKRITIYQHNELAMNE